MPRAVRVAPHGHWSRKPERPPPGRRRVGEPGLLGEGAAILRHQSAHERPAEADHRPHLVPTPLQAVDPYRREELEEREHPDGHHAAANDHARTLGGLALGVGRRLGDRHVQGGGRRPRLPREPVAQRLEPIEMKAATISGREIHAVAHVQRLDVVGVRRHQLECSVGHDERIGRERWRLDVSGERRGRGGVAHDGIEVGDPDRLVE